MNINKFLKIKPSPDDQKSIRFELVEIAENNAPIRLSFYDVPGEKLIRGMNPGAQLGVVIQMLEMRLDHTVREINDRETARRIIH